MKFILGIVLVFAAVVGGYLLSHGDLWLLYQPFELLIILGGAFGSFVIANTKQVIIGSIKGILSLLKGSLYGKQHYMDVLGLMFDLFSKSRKEGLMALEGDIEEPEQSPIFQKYPKIQSNHHLVDFICDYLRLMVGGNMNAFELENLMDIELQTHHHEAEKPSSAITLMSDGLPAFGIVAAVMGVVITMGFISEPPEVLGAHVGAALVGTFLGILLAYGFVGPMGNAMAAQVEEEAKLYESIKICILATLNGYTPQIAVEFGRKVLFSHVRPGFIELEDYIKNNK